jgi:2-haloacid dehalogenase
MSTVTTVLFDLGGVLIDWDPNHLFGEIIPDDAERQFFLTEICSPAWNHEMDAGRSVPESVAALAADHPDHAELIGIWWDRWPEMLGGPIAGTLDLANEMSEAGVPMYALTNWAAETWPHAVARFDFLTTLFDGIVVSGHEGIAKPDPAIFDLVIDRFGLDPQATLFIDDVEANIAVADRAGFVTHRFTSPGHLRASLAAIGLTPTR